MGHSHQVTGLGNGSDAMQYERGAADYTVPAVRSQNTRLAFAFRLVRQLRNASRFTKERSVDPQPFFNRRKHLSRVRERCALTRKRPTSSADEGPFER
jgi:hypothetical protein